MDVLDIIFVRKYKIPYEQEKKIFEVQKENLLNKNGNNKNDKCH